MTGMKTVMELRKISEEAVKREERATAKRVEMVAQEDFNIISRDLERKIEDAADGGDFECVLRNMDMGDPQSAHGQTCLRTMQLLKEHLAKTDEGFKVACKKGQLVVSWDGSGS